MHSLEHILFAYVLASFGMPLVVRLAHMVMYACYG